jgi:hypothetical protein
MGPPYVPFKVGTPVESKSLSPELGIVKKQNERSSPAKNMVRYRVPDQHAGLIFSSVPSSALLTVPLPTVWLILLRPVPLLRSKGQKNILRAHFSTDGTSKPMRARGRPNLAGSWYENPIQRVNRQNERVSERPWRRL